ncbi:MAG: hypothetical protein KA207_02830 [Burkholderiaceae bacterium]|nr:hypothetical protein [Burkholderiaceae bacterium]
MHFACLFDQRVGVLCVGVVLANQAPFSIALELDYLHGFSSGGGTGWKSFGWFALADAIASSMATRRANSPLT